MPEWPPDYEAALKGTALADFPPGGRLLVSGKAPAQMLSGVITGRVPSAPERVDEDLWMGRGSYSAILTSKGKMITDLRLFWLDPEEEAFLLDIPRAGLEATLAHFQRFLPPRLAQVKDVTAEAPSITVVGPEAAALIARETCGLRIDAAQLDALEEDAFFLLGGKDEDRVRVTRCGQLSVPAFEVATRPGAMAALQALMLKGGARALSEEMWHTLRIEAGRPVYGIDMGENTIPIEAGIGDRAIDHAK